MVGFFGEAKQSLLRQENLSQKVDALEQVRISVCFFSGEVREMMNHQ